MLGSSRKAQTRIRAACDVVEFSKKNAREHLGISLILECVSLRKPVKRGRRKKA